VLIKLIDRFPEDESLKTTYTQFLLGSSLLITPVLIPNVDTVNGVFPGIGEGTRWYDWYTLEEVSAQPQENKTLSAPLEHINVHARGGTVFILQEPEYTTAEVKNSSYSLLVALDENESAKGTVYLDDGVSLEPASTKLVTVSYNVSSKTSLR
jgi:alpha-glucosidase